MKDTMIDVQDIVPISRATDAARLGGETYDRLVDLLEQLDGAQWEAETECAPWTVADIVRHIVGAAKGHVSVRETVRQVRHGRKHAAAFGGSDLDATNDLQVRDHAALSPAELIDEVRQLGTAAVRKRMKQPRLIRRINVPNSPGGSTAPGMPPSIRLGHLFDVILTRDIWLHRIDIARAAGIELEPDEVDRRIIEDVVAEWAGRHGRPFELVLTGPAGGHFVSGDGGPRLELDAIEFARVLSGRAPEPHELLATRVLF